MSGSGLAAAGIRDPNPVIFYEIKQLYRDKKIEEDLLVGDGALVPLGKAKVVREGEDVTMVSYGQTVYQCLEAADNLAAEGFSAEVIDLRTLVPLDNATIIESLRKTNRIVCVNEAPMTCGFAGEVLARISQDAFELLDAPPVRVTRMDTPVPWVKPLEFYVLPSPAKITEAALRTCRY